MCHEKAIKWDNEFKQSEQIITYYDLVAGHDYRMHKNLSTNEA